MTVLMISPGYPAEMAFFTRGLGQAGVRVIGLGDQSPDALPPEAKTALDHYVHTGSLAAEDHVVGLVREMARRIGIDQVECLWEPYMVLAARLREELGLPGLTVEQTVPFRDKERMKQLLDRMSLLFDWIILDSPPALAVHDASILADMCDGVLFVVRAGSTDFELAAKASAEFREKNLLGVVLNRVEKRDSYGDYYYGYDSEKNGDLDSKH